MAAVSSNARQPAANLWRRCAAFGGLALLGAFWGALVAVGGLNALYLCVSLLGCVFILHDFRVGVVLLIVLMPISSAAWFPRAMLGITGLNPLNLLLLGTLGSCLLQGLFDGSIRRFLPGPLLWLYVVPFLIAGAIGPRHVTEISPAFFWYEKLDFHDAAGYMRDLVVKPLFMVIFGLLVGAAVSRSRKPENFLVPTLVAIWVMGLMVIVYVANSGLPLSQLGSRASREFLSPLGMHANDLGRVYAVAYALLLFIWAESKDAGVRLALLVSMGMVVVALILTFSRGAFLGFILINVLFLLWRGNARMLILFGLLAVVALFALPEAVYERVTTGYGEGVDEISSGRIEKLWLPLLPEVLRNPIYGSGIGAILWSDYMRGLAETNVLGITQAHNAYLETLLDMGIAGLILVCAYLVHVWKGFRALAVDPALSPTMHGFYLGAAAGLASFLVAGIVGSRLTPAPEQIFLWLAIGMMYGQRARQTDDLSASRQPAQAGSRAQSA